MLCMLWRFYHFILWRTLLLYANEFRFGSGLKPVPFFIYPSFLQAPTKLTFGLLAFLVGIMRFSIYLSTDFLAPELLW